MSLPVLPLHRNHSRFWRENKFVYPVLSRRSLGISIGLNLNPDKICNFDCIYCQVNRRSEAETKFVERDRMLAELDQLLAFVTSGEIYNDENFQSVPTELRRLNDIAFSGDGEPTTYRNFDEIVCDVAELKAFHNLDTVKMILITNASMFHRPVVEKALKTFDQNQGEIWAKLEAGSEEYYQQVERTTIPFSRILENIAIAAKVRPIVIQSLFMRIDGLPPTSHEIDAFCNRLNGIVERGGVIQTVQIYTVARHPAESKVTSLLQVEVNEIADEVVAQTALNVERFY